MTKKVDGAARCLTLRQLRDRRPRVPVWRVLGLAMALTAAPLVSVGHPLWAPPVKAHPVKPGRHTVAFVADPASSHRLAGPATQPSAGSRSVAQAAPIPAPAPATTPTATAPAQNVPEGGVAVVGVSWPSGSVAAGDQFQIRTLSDGAWGTWETLERGDGDHGPDRSGPGASEALVADTATKGITEPYVVAGAEKFEVRALSTPGTAPTAASVEVVDPGTSEADAPTTAGPGAAAADPVYAVVARPTIKSRAQWGADESLRRAAPAYGDVQVGFVHHTVGSNTYTAGQVPAIIRGMYAFHVNGNGWSDLGYNFVVDRFGGIWEGRYGGIDKAVVGAQTMNFNSVSFGASGIGNFVSATPPTAMVDAFTRLFAWKHGVHGIPATGTVVAGGKSFNRISGHRDGFSTACPGQVLYNKLPQIRSAAAAIIAKAPKPTLPLAAAVTRDVSLAGTPSLLMYPGSQSPPSISGGVSILSGAPALPILRTVVIGTRGWTALRNAAMSPDLTGDGRPDIVAQDPATSQLRVYRGNGLGGFSGMTPIGKGWNTLNRVLPAGDRNGDGLNDLLATTAAGELYLYTGNGAGNFTGRTRLGTGWGAISSIIPTADVTGDRIPDVLGISKPDGQMILYPGRANGSIFRQGAVGGGWGGFTAVLNGGDLDRDGDPDVLARAADGTMRSYFRDSAAGLNRANRWGKGWSALSQLSAGVDWDGDQIPDITGVTSAGAMVLYSGNGRRDFDRTIGSFPAVAGADLTRIIGDVDGDGYSDAVARIRTDGSLVLLRGSAGGVMRVSKVLGTAGWNAITMIEQAGDLNGDRVPDLIARGANGELWLYPLTRSLVFKHQRVQIGAGWNAMLSVVGVGPFSTSPNADVVALTSDHSLVLYRADALALGKLAWGRVLATGQNDLVQLLGVGDLNGDLKPDVLGRSANGLLWLYAGDGLGKLVPGRQPVLGGKGSSHVIG